MNPIYLKVFSSCSSAQYVNALSKALRKPEELFEETPLDILIYDHTSKQFQPKNSQAPNIYPPKHHLLPNPKPPISSLSAFQFRKP